MVDDRKVALENAKSTAAKYNLKYFDVSAKTDQNVKECMEEIFNQSIKHKFQSGNEEAGDDKNARISVARNDLKNKDNKKKGCAC